MDYKTIYIYKEKGVWIGEFKIKAWGEDFVMGQSIKPLEDNSNEANVKAVLEDRMFKSLWVIEYAVKGKLPKSEIVDDKGNIKEKKGLKIVELMPKRTTYGIKYAK